MRLPPSREHKAAEEREARVGTITVVGGKLLSPADGLHGEPQELLVQDGKICKIGKPGESLEREGEVLDAKGAYVTPGFIDIHAHCYPKAFLGMSPDVLGLDREATTILDAGSSGAVTYEDFRINHIDKAQTKVFTLLNVSKEGLIYGHELNDLSKVDLGLVRETVARHRDNIVGLKARASASVVGEQGLKPIAMAADIAHELALPLMVHIGNYPPALKDVLGLLDRGDIITHAYHGKPGGILTPERDAIIPEALAARERGVRFDVGHGVASFSFRTFERALELGFDCDSISTDLHVQNYNGPVYSITSVLSKLLNCGETLEQVVSKCTSVPAGFFGLAGLGHLNVGDVADLNLVNVVDCDEAVEDSIGDSLEVHKKLVVTKTIYSREGTSAVIDRA